LQLQFELVECHNAVCKTRRWRAVALVENYSTSKPLKVSPEKSQILSCDTLVANGRNVKCLETKNVKQKNLRA
jgi:hypothetical protein